MEVSQNSIVMRVSDAVPLLSTQELCQFKHIFDCERWNERLHEFEAVHVLVCLFFREDRGLVEAAEAINQRLKCLLVPLSVSLILSFA